MTHILHRQTDHSYPVAAGGQGVFIRDAAGKEYIESIAGLWCASLGFDNERLVQAAAAQVPLPRHSAGCSVAAVTRTV